MGYTTPVYLASLLKRDHCDLPLLMSTCLVNLDSSIWSPQSFQLSFSISTVYDEVLTQLPYGIYMPPLLHNSLYIFAIFL